MAHISSIGSGMFSDLAIATATLTPTQIATTSTTAKLDFDALMDTSAEIVRVKNVRDFPEMGTPPNIVNVPVYGQKSSQQIQGQSDAPSLAITVNYIPLDWASGSVLGSMVGDGVTRLFRFALLNSPPQSLSQTNDYASSYLGLGTVQNSYYYWLGKVEALLVKPDLKDANTAVITLSIQSQFFGAYTV